MDVDSQISLLAKLVATPTVNGQEAACATIIKEVLAAHQIPARLLPLAPGRASLVAEVGDAGPVLALAGHLDTVASGEGWRAAPFSGTVIDQAVYGRGAVDMKGGLAAMVCALIALHEGGGLHCRVRLLASADEEVGGRGARQLVAAGLVDDLAGMVIGEATSGTVQYAHCGSFDYRVSSRGRQAHSSKPQLGINAVTNLVPFITAEAHAFDDAPANRLLGRPVHSVTVFHGGDQLNTIPARAFLEGNVRTVPECNNPATKDRLGAIINRLNQRPGYQLGLEVLASFAPMATDPASPFVTRVRSAVAAATGHQPALAISHGATDASFYVQGRTPFPIVVYGPGDEKRSHQVDEALPVADYLAAIRAYQELARHFS